MVLPTRRACVDYRLRQMVALRNLVLYRRRIGAVDNHHLDVVVRW